MLDERDLEVADRWIRDHVLDNRDHDFDDCEEEGDVVKYFFTRHRDRAWIVFLLRVEDGKLISIKREVYHYEAEGKDDESTEPR